MDQLLHNGQHQRKNQAVRRMAAKQTAILYLASLEETGQEKVKPDLIGRKPTKGLSMEQNQYGGVAKSPILGITIIIERHTIRGYETLLYYYENVASFVDEPLLTRLVSTVVCH